MPTQPSQVVLFPWHRDEHAVALLLLIQDEFCIVIGSGSLPDTFSKHIAGRAAQLCLDTHWPVTGQYAQPFTQLTQLSTEVVLYSSHGHGATSGSFLCATHTCVLGHQAQTSYVEPTPQLFAVSPVQVASPAPQWPVHPNNGQKNWLLMPEHC